MLENRYGIVCHPKKRSFATAAATAATATGAQLLRVLDNRKFTVTGRFGELPTLLSSKKRSLATSAVTAATAAGAPNAATLLPSHAPRNKKCKNKLTNYILS